MTQLADKIKEALEAGRSGQFAKKTPYERFGFKQNPFRLKIDPDELELQIAREDVLLEFAVQVGNAIRLFEEDLVSPFRNMLAHGLRRCGKSFLARQFVREWDQIGVQDYKTIYTNLSEWREPIELQEEFGSSTKTLETYENFLKKIKILEKPLIIFIDNLDYTITGTPAIPRIRQFLGDIEKFGHHGFIIIGFVNSLTLTVLQDPEHKILAHNFLSLFNPEYFFFPIFSRAEIRRLIIQRIKTARSPTELFSAKAIELIADHCLGLPTIAMQIASACLNELIAQNIVKVTTKVVKAVLSQLGYIDAVKLVESVIEGTDEETTSLITPKRKDIITAILSHQLRERYFFPPTGVEGLRTSDLAELYGVNLSTMNYHIKPLASSFPVPILETKDDIHDARSKIFFINWQSHMSNALEIITVYQQLNQTQYHITPKAILSPRRSEI
ncbi:MAG: AAA family ATPase [Candidatus Hodarchaeota archaeon]